MEMGILALGGELHAHANTALLARGSEQKDSLGILICTRIKNWKTGLTTLPSSKFVQRPVIAPPDAG